MDQNTAISEYQKKLKSKTVSGEYVKLDIVLGNEDEEEEKPKKPVPTKTKTKKGGEKKGALKRKKNQRVYGLEIKRFVEFDF